MLKFLFAALVTMPLSATAATPLSIPPEKVISAVTGDWNNDGSMDRAVLIDSGDSNADILIYLNDGSDNFTLAGSDPAIAFNGGRFGNSPELRLSKTGALQVHSQNMAIGRDHWERVLTLSYRNGQFVVSGITASDYDTLDPKSAGSCDINLLTGRGLSDRKKVVIKSGGIALAQWNHDKMPKVCQ